MSVPVKIIKDGYSSADNNMEADKSLLKNITPEEITLRFYAWEKKSITYGLSKKALPDLNVDACKKDNIAVSVRPTGGSIVFHGAGIDFTYSIACGKNIVDKYLSQDLTKNYEIIHTLIIKALLFMGVSSSLCAEDNDNGMPQSCFLRFAKGDILIDGKKVGGAAIRLNKKGMLFQGYLSLSTNGLAKYIKNISQNDLDTYSYPLNKVINTDDNIQNLKENILREIENYFSV